MYSFNYNKKRTEMVICKNERPIAKIISLYLNSIKEMETFVEEWLEKRDLKLEDGTIIRFNNKEFIK